MQRFVSPIGFSSNLVTRPIIANGISSGDKVEILRLEQPDEGDDDQAQNAIDNVRSTLSGVVSNFELEVIMLSEFELAAVVDRCSQVIMDGPPPVVCLGAGATDVHVPMLLAAIAHNDYVAATMMYSDLRSTTRKVNLPPLTADLPGRTIETFEALGAADPDTLVSLAEIAAVTDVSRTTVGRHVHALADRGFIETATRNKELVARLTVFGRLIFRNRQSDTAERE